MKTDVWLGIETTTSGGGVALISEEKLIAESFLPVCAVHSEKILPAVAEIMRITGVKPDELRGIGVSLGPGSYTGLRIGISTAMGLSAGWNVPLKGIGTLGVIAASVFCRGPVLACIRARNSEVFAAVYSAGDVLSEELIAPQVYRTDSLISRLNAEYCGIAAVGSGRSELAAANVQWLPEIHDSPRPSIAALLAARLSSTEGFDSQLHPLYMRSFNQKAVDIDP